MGLGTRLTGLYKGIEPLQEGRIGDGEWVIIKRDRMRDIRNERYQEEDVRDKNNDTNHVLKDAFYVPYRSFLAVTIRRSAAAM